MNGYVFSLCGIAQDGQSRVADGETYGGEALLFVVADVSFASALKVLLSATEGNGFEITRMVNACHPDAFEAEDFPFPNDLDAMLEDAVQSGEICVTDGNTFAPMEQQLSCFTLGFADIFDPSRENDHSPYAGEIVPFAIKVPPHLALEGLLLRCQSENLTLKGVHEVADAVFASPDVMREILNIDGNEGALSRGQLCWGNVYSYEREEDD